MPPRGSKKPEFGDPCKQCGVAITTENCVYNHHKLRSSCKSCYSEYQRNYRLNNPDKQKGYDLKDIYGITLEQYRNMEALQLGGCAICKQPCKTGQMLSVDHNHKTGVIRDLLCKRCNMIIGLCGEDELLLLEIMDYIKRHQVGKVA